MRGVVLFGLCFLAGGAVASPVIKRVDVPKTAKQWAKYEVSLDIRAAYQNPFDPEQVEVWAIFRAPDGRRVKVPGFYFEPWRIGNPGGVVLTNPGKERHELSGRPCFKVRFCPVEPGVYSFEVFVRDKTGLTKAGPFTFHCLPSEGHGFVRISEGNPRYFEFDDGSPFVPVGLCVPWARGNWEGDTYDHYIAKISESGGNAIRVWMCHWAWLEWTPGGKGSLRGYRGVGWYNQRICANFDRILELCEQYGVYVMLCFNNACWEFGRPDGKHWAYDSWGGNPYNVKNGGPCLRPADFWTNPEARRLYKRKLRYIVARWGYSPNVWAWELWNEIGRASEAIAQWHKEMASYLRKVDPNRHLVTTSSWDPLPNEHLWEEMDFTQIHGDLSLVEPMLDKYPGKPLVVGEGPVDEEGRAIRRSLWQALLSGAAGPPLTWAFLGRGCPIDRNGFWGLYKAISRFVKGIPLGRLSPRKPKVRGLERRKFYAPVVIRPLLGSWLVRAPRSRFYVPPDGRVDASGLSKYLYGSAPERAPYRNPPTFVVDFKVSGEFWVCVHAVSGRAVLGIYLDGRPVLRREFPGSGRRRPRPGEQIVKVSIPPGRHEIRVDNLGSDWIGVSWYGLSNYVDASCHPPLDVYCLAGSDLVLLWAANRLDSPEAREMGLESFPVSAEAEIRGVRDGSYKIEFWDVRRGRVLSVKRARAEGGRLKISLLKVREELAVRCKRLGG